MHSIPPTRGFDSAFIDERDPAFWQAPPGCRTESASGSAFSTKYASRKTLCQGISTLLAGLLQRPLLPPAAAGKGEAARAPRAPAGGWPPPAPLLCRWL